MSDYGYVELKFRRFFVELHELTYFNFELNYDEIVIEDEIVFSGHTLSVDDHQ